MTVYHQKGKDGRRLSTWSYRFMVAGKDYSGVCVGAETIEQAREYERRMRETVNELRKQRNVKALVENFRAELSGGDAISLEDAFKLADEKPKRRNAGEKQTAARRSMFSDFVRWMRIRNPEARTLMDVTRQDAEKYAGELHGRSISARTANRYIATCEWVFRMLEKDSGIQSNPFADIPAMRVEAEDREAFTEEELKTIMEKADSFTKPLFVIGLCTALREGDIATLKWSEIDRRNGIIRRKMRKTGKLVEIPIMPKLDEYLAELASVQDASGYVLPDHAKMEMENPTGICYRVKKFLEKTCGIRTTRKSRTGRNVSVKDIHSLRHTFCYLAGLAGIPLVIVQGIVGHMTKEMTAHYSQHADIQAKKQKMAFLPLLSESTNPLDERRERIIKAVKEADENTLDLIEKAISQKRMSASGSKELA